MSINHLSLTPGFSRVIHAARPQQPFQRLCLDAKKTVETVLVIFLSPTGLKPGVNEIVE